MREIKFRGWHKGLKEMVYQGEHCGYVEYMEYSTNPVNAINIILNEDEDGYIYMQYTGLKDCNGIEIYEGDIVSFDDCTSTESGYWEQQCIGVVEWCDETVSFEVSNRLSAESYEVLSECLVIGNIYENPELLE